MIGSLYCVGFTPTELANFVFNLDMERLIKGEQGMISGSMFDYYNLYNKFGMYEAIDLENKLEELIEAKTGIKQCTFSQIEKNLTIVVTNLNFQHVRLLNRTNTPDLVISKAVRMSISYPMIITPVLFEGDYYGDGGEFLNYPITMFADELDQTIGITFSAHNENRNCTLKDRMPISSFYDYTKSVALTLSRSAYFFQITQEFLDRSIVIEIGEEIDSMKLNLTPEEKHKIYRYGINAAKNQIEDILGLDIKKRIEESMHLLPSLEHSFELIE